MSKGLPRSLSRSKGQSALKTQIFKISDLAISVAGTSGVGYGTAVLGDFPEGNILFLGAVSYVKFSSSDADIQATFDGDYSIGTTATSDATLSAGDVNIVGSTAFGAAASAGVTGMNRGANATSAVFDNTDGSLELNLNVIIDDANISGTADMLANGYVSVAYAVMLDD